MTAGRLTEKSGKFYIVLSYKNNEGKHKEKWVATGLDVKGNKRKANEMLSDYKENYNVTTGELNLSAKVERPKTNNLSDIIKTPQLLNPSIMNNINPYGEILFGDYMLDWLEGQKSQIELTTYAGYKIAIETRIAPHFNKKGITLNSLTPDDIEKFYKDRLKSVTANTVIHYHANIRKALQSAYFKGIIPNNPADRVQRPRADKYTGSYYNKEDMMKLLESVEDKKIEFAVFMACYYGLRRGEIMGLKWDAVDFEYKTFAIRHTVTNCTIDGKQLIVAKNRAKNKKSLRTLPIIPSLEKLLLKMKMQQEKYKNLFGNSYNNQFSDYIYVEANGERVKPDTVSHGFSLHLKNNNMRHIRFHDLRHSCATLLRHEGVPMEDIQKWLGHSTITTTENIYAHFENKQHIVSANKIANALTSNSESVILDESSLNYGIYYNDREDDCNFYNNEEFLSEKYDKKIKKSDFEM